MSFATTVPQGPTIPPSGNFSSIAVSGGMIDMYDALITNVADPIDDKDAANKEYVDNAVAEGGGGIGTPFTMPYYNSSGKLVSITGITSDGTNDMTALGTITANTLDSTILTVDNTPQWLQGPKLFGTTSNEFSCVYTTDIYALTSQASNSSVLIYKKVNNIWSKLTQISPSNEIGFSVFGSAISMVVNGSTQLALIGGPNDNSNIGAVWVFSNTGSGWTQRAKIIPSDNTGNANFGVSVSLVVSGTTYTAVIGGPNDNGNIGAAWIYQSNGGVSWTEITKIVPSDNIGNAHFGTSVYTVVTGTTYTAIIGGPNDNGNIGAAWIYQSVSGGGSGWNKIIKISPSDNLNTSTFGTSVSLTLTSNIYDALIGGPNDNGGTGAGAAWIYRSTGGASGWAKVIKIIASDEVGVPVLFGQSVSIYGNTAIMGGYGDSSFTGATWIYKNPGSGWTELLKLVPVGVTTSSDFGYSVSLSQNQLISGAPQASQGLGAAWIYNYELDTVTIENGNISIPGTITAGIISDGYGSTLTGGVITGTVLTDKTFSVTGGVFKNATITATSNNVAAKSLVSSSGLVSVNTTVPVANSVLTATSSTVATWQALPAPTPGGFNTQIQYNSGGLMSGNPGLTYSGTDLDIGTWTALSNFSPGTSSYGTSTAIYGTVAMVGDPADNSSIGAVYVYKKNGNVWTQLIKLIPTGVIGSFGGFGTSISLVGNTALIGGINDNSNLGAVWVFHDPGSGWVQVTKLVPTGNIGGSGIGISVSMYTSGSTYTAVIGGFLDNNGVGAVWIFQSSNSGATWTQITKIVPVDGIGGNSRFGCSVSLSLIGTTYIAAIGGNNDNNQNGAVWIYQGVSNGGSAGNWTEVVKIPSNNNGFFGQSVSLYGDGVSTYNLAVGAENETVSAVNSGAAYIYISTDSGATWTLVTQLISVGVVFGNLGFGWSCALYNNVVLISSYYQGSTWVFRNYSGVWQFETKLQPVGNSSGSYVSLYLLNGVYTAMIGEIGNSSASTAWGYDDLITDVNGSVTTNGIIMTSGSIGTATSANFATVTANGRQGIITITGITKATSSVTSMTINNVDVTSSSVILFSILSCAAGTNNFSVNAYSIGSGTYNITVCNNGASVTGATIQIGYLLLN